MTTTTDKSATVNRNSAAWTRARTAALKRDQYRCQGCTAHPGKTPGVDLHVHHIRPIHNGGTHDLDNLVTVCNACHTELHRHEDSHDELDLSLLENSNNTTFGFSGYRKDRSKFTESRQAVCQLLIENGPTKLNKIIEQTGYSRGCVQENLDLLRIGNFVCRVERGVYAYIPTREYREIQQRDPDETGRIEVGVWDPGKQTELGDFADPREEGDS
jgi:hypothetical protein